MLPEQHFTQPPAAPPRHGIDMSSQNSSSHSARSNSSTPNRNLEHVPWVAGHYRRLERQSVLPRSTTTPVLPKSSLDLDSATMGLPNNMSPISLPEYESEHRVVATPTRIPSASTSSNSPSSTLKTATEGKKKGRILGAFKSRRAHDRERPSSSDGLLPTTPLPFDGQLSSPKAAKLLGLPPPPFPPEPRFENTESSFDIEGDDHVMGSRPMFSYQADGHGEGSGESPEATESRNYLEGEWRYEDDGPRTSQTAFQRLRKGTNKKALKMLDIMPLSLAPRPKSSGRDGENAPVTALDAQDDDAGYHSDGDRFPRRRSTPQLAPPPNRRARRRKKGQKSLERMSPITEASLSDNGYIGVDGENAELEVISEYDVYNSSMGQGKTPYPTLGTSVTAPVFQGPFELGGVMVSPHGISPANEEEEKGAEQNNEGLEMQEHPQKQPFLQFATTSQRQWKAPEKPPQYHIKSPLQEVESTLLDSTAKLLQDNMKLREKTDSEIHRLHELNDDMKRELKNIKSRSTVPYTSQPSDEDDGDTESEDELEDEWTIEEATAVTFTRITPGTVKLVDIPPRKVKTTGSATGQVTPAKSIKSDFSRAPMMRGGMGQSHQLSPQSPYRSSDFAFQREKKKSKLSREESLNSIEGWITSSASIAERPFSMQFDPDVFADQNLDRPPTPPPKDASKAFSDHISSPKHHCIHNGHLFHAISLRKVPDKVVLNSLQVSPFLVTTSGAKQHVKVPVACENCGHNVKEEVWECEVPVCKLSVCYDCAVAMQAEWEGRVVKSWDEKPTKGMAA